MIMHEKVCGPQGWFIQVRLTLLARQGAGFLTPRLQIISQVTLSLVYPICDYHTCRGQMYH